MRDDVVTEQAPGAAHPAPGAAHPAPARSEIPPAAHPTVTSDDVEVNRSQTGEILLV